MVKKVPKPGEAIRALWRRGDLDYILRPAQEKIQQEYYKTNRKLFVANCSRRIGKSYWCAKVCIETALRTPLRKIKYASAFLKDVEEIILPAFRFILSNCPDDLRPTFMATKKKFIFPNGSEIQLVGLDRNPDGIRGQYCDLFIFEEAGFITNLQYLYSSVVIPMFKGRPGAKAIMISTPPRTPAHPFSGFCQKAEAEGAYIKLTIEDDPLVTEEELKEWRDECLTETDWKREYLCLFVTDETLAVIPEWRDELIAEVPPDEFRRYYHNYVGMDIGVRDKTVALLGYYDFARAKLIVVDEVVMEGSQMTTDKLAAAIKEKETLHFDGKTYLRVGDNNNLLLLQDLGALHGLPFFATDKDDLHSMVNKVRMWVKSGRIIVHPRCKETIGCLRYAIWKENRKEFDRSISYGHFDALSGLIYLCRNIREHVNPIPAEYGINWDHTHGRQGLKNRGTAETIGKMFKR